jgi:hypothetical protein
MFFITLNKVFSFTGKNMLFSGGCLPTGCIVRQRMAKISSERRKACERGGKKADSLGSGRPEAAGGPFRENGEPAEP